MRVDVQRERPATRGEHRALADDASVVVEPPARHEPQSVRVAWRHLGVRHRAVPLPERGRDRAAGASTHGLGCFGAVGSAAPRVARPRAATSPSTLIGSHDVPEPSSARIDSAAGAEHDLVAVLAAAGARRRRAPAPATTRSTPASAGATRAISSVTSSTVARSMSAPSRSASSTAMRQSSIARALGRDLAADALHAAFEVRDAAGLLAPERAAAAPRRRRATCR